MALSERFEEAMIYAFRLHYRQKRKGTDTPYIAHLLGAASIALDYGASETEAIAALLHDAIEDQGGAAAREEIRRRFGDAVAEIVDGCTDADTHPKPPWQERKEAYIASLSGATPSVRLVSASDKLHNARSILADLRANGDTLWQRFKGGKDGTLWYYREITRAFQESGSSPIVEELARTVLEIERMTDRQGSER